MHFQLGFPFRYREGKLRHENNCLSEQDGDENGGGLCLVFCKVTAKQQITTMQGKITSPVKSKVKLPLLEFSGGGTLPAAQLEQPKL